MRARRAGGGGLVTGQGIEVVNKIGKWSEMHGIGKTSTTEVVRPDDKTRSKI